MRSVARIDTPERSREYALVIDYEGVSGTKTGYTFKGDMTYLVESQVFLSAGTTFEGGAVIKTTGSGSLKITGGAVNFLSTQYHPVVFTSKNDNSVGEALCVSSCSPGQSSATTLRT